MVVVAEIVVKNGACSVLSDVIFVFGATKTDEQKEDTPLDEENVVQNRLGIACYLHMVASCFFVMGLLTAIASSYLLISSGKGREGCCQTKKDYLQQHRWNHESRTVFACSRKSCRPIVQKELGKFQSEYYFDLIMSPGLIGFRAYAAIRNHDNEVMVNEFDQDVMQLEIAEAESGDKNVAVDAH
ncbi:hypothetical protein RB195_014925 [Necator americanus]|uniref:Uncharacterized protein n=1 Tax=Necator americanus TaxID=51031 RepID=A0ABR1E3H7_NECAM